jgi:hypothetical protein
MTAWFETATRIRFSTSSGSLYELDREQLTWTRLKHHPDSDSLRTESGQLYEWPEVVVGEPVVMLGAGLSFGVREITTSPVTAIGPAPDDIIT